MVPEGNDMSLSQTCQRFPWLNKKVSVKGYDLHAPRRNDTGEKHLSPVGLANGSSSK